MKIIEIVKKYGENKKHLENTSRLSFLLFSKLKNYFPFLEKYDNPADLTLLGAGAMLHDIGINFEDAYGVSHHKAGAKFIFENTPDEIIDKDKEILCCLIRYHRKSLPKENHEFYKDLDEEQKEKVNCLASIIRFADGLDCLHLNLVEDFKIDFNKKKNALTIYFGGNIMLNAVFLETVSRKTDFFKKVFNTDVTFKDDNNV